jgi:hypothetical protein
VRQEQPTLPLPVVAILAACLHAEARGRLWWGMAAVLALPGTLTIVVPIPFWDSKIALLSVAGIDYAILLLSLSLSISYESHLRWMASLPCPVGLTVAAGTIAKAAIAFLAVLVAALFQAATFMLLRPGDGAAASAFLSGLIPAAGITVLVMTPWTILARLALGRIAGPFALIALSLAASWSSGDLGGSPLRFVACLVPWLPTSSGATTPALAWLYAVVHGAAVATGAGALLRRAR